MNSLDDLHYSKPTRREKISTPDFMATIDPQQKSPRMPSPFAEEIIQLTRSTPRPAPQKRSFVDTLSKRPTSMRQYSDDPEQYEGGRPRYLVLLGLAVVLLVIAVLGFFLFMPK